MLRTEINQAIQKVLHALEDSAIEAVMTLATEREDSKRKGGRTEVLSSFAKYMQASLQFGVPEKEILKILDLEDLSDLGMWEVLLTGEEKHPVLFHLTSSVRFALLYLPKLLQLLDREVDSLRAREKKGKDSNQSILTVVVLEDHGFSSPQRLVLALEAITGLYDSCAALEGEKGGNLSVLACDSGSDKSLDFLGLAKVVSCVKEVILSFWDKVVYFREDKTGKQLELISNSLPILERLAEMRASQKLEPEQAELIKRQIVDSITKFGQAGVTIPEIEDRTVFNPRQLMRAEQKLLIAPETADDQQGEKTTDQTPKKEIDIPLDDPEFQKLLERTTREFVAQRHKADEKQECSEAQEKNGSQSKPGKNNDNDGEGATADHP
jgi:hypothetical protein